MAFIWIQVIGFNVGLFFSRVVVSDLGRTAGLIAGALSGIGFVVLGRREFLLRYVSFKALLVLAMGVMFGYGAVAWGFSWTANMVFGRPSAQIVVVTGWQSGSRKHCSHPQIGHPLLADSPRSLCVNASARARMPDGSRLRLVGTGSILGLNVEEIYVESEAQQAPASEQVGLSQSEKSSMEQMSAQPELACEPNSDSRKEVRVRHIAIEAFARDTTRAKAATPDELRAAHEKLQLARKALSDGDSFETVWRKYSDPQTSGGNPDGYIGWFKRGELVPEAEDIVFCLPKGEISPVFRTIFGFHVMQVTDVRY